MFKKSTSHLSTKKPSLRGYLHQEAFFVSLGAGAMLIAKSSNSIALVASSVFILGLLSLFGISAIYHRPHWNPQPRALLKRFDHSAIFILIASTFTPICLLALASIDGQRLLIVIWSAALAGILQSIFWVKAPKAVTAIFYVVMGWFALPYLGQLQNSLGNSGLFLLFLGGLVYTLGAVIYAIKKPNLVVGVFGYHELFHLLTIIGAALHFVVIYQLIT